VRHCPRTIENAQAHGLIYRFISLFGIYYSLQYLSLSDATVLTFLTPMYTAVTGAVLLGEVITRRQILAGGKSPKAFLHPESVP
jgi:EamA-like transporter family